MAQLTHIGMGTQARYTRRTEAACTPAQGTRAAFPRRELCASAAVLLAALVVCAFTGKWPTGDNPYRSYTLQALAWLEGRLDLGQDYPWLELAIVEGKYFVSFPPFPSLVLLPFAAVFGANTPDHFISLAVTLLGVVYAVRLCRAMGEEKDSVQLALYLYLCNGYLFIAVQGWVWFLAQTMCFTLSLMALYHAMQGRGGVSLLCWACAVGCRPMVIVYLPLLLCLLWRAWDAQTPRLPVLVLIKQKWPCGIAAGLMALLYMALNAARFGNPLEFGHNYLPEFVRSEAGQFSLSYVRDNLTELLRLPQPGGENGALIFPTYDCMAFWLISPLVITFALAWGHAVVCRRRTLGMERLLLPVMAFLHLMIVLCHRTLGGWQFGNRYLLDMMPWLFYGMLAMKPEDERFLCLNTPLALMGLAINLVGTVAAYNHWI